MSAQIEYKGKDVEAAINQACDSLNVSRDELNIEIVSTGSAGIFGLGRRKAVIQVTRKNSQDNATTNNTNDSSSRAPSPQKSALKKNPPASRQRKPSHQDGVMAARADETVPPPSQEIVEEIKEILLSIIKFMGYTSDITTTVSGNRIAAHLSGEHTKALIGQDGDTLDAIQYLMRKIISHKYPEKLYFSLDSGSFRDDRKKELEELALDLASKVKETGKTRTIAALNPAERRIIHVTLQDDSAIRSSSIGEGLYKKIRIFVPGKGKKRPPRRPRSGKPSSPVKAVIQE